MLVRLGLASFWRQRRWMLLLALMAGMIAAFCGTYPGYNDRLLEASALQIVTDLSQEKANITFYNPAPISRDVDAILDGMLGGLFRREIRFSRATGPSDVPSLDKICGYEYAEGEPLTLNTPYLYSPNHHCYIVYSFDPLPEIFRPVDGDLPQPLDPPADPISTTPPAMGAAQIEAAITTANAEQTGLAVGDRIVVGDDPARAAVVEIVGLVEPVFDPENVFWHSHGAVLTGEWTPYGDDRRLDIGLIVAEQAFAEWTPVIAANAYYAWWLDVPPSAVTAERLRALDRNLDDTMQQIRHAHPDVSLVSGLFRLSADYEDDIAGYKGAVRVVYGAIVVWFAGLLAVTAARVFADRRAEWAILVQNGATRRQILGVILLSVGAAVGAGAIIGALFARLMLDLFSPASLPGASTSWTDVLLFASGGAAVAAVALIAAAWRVSRWRYLPDHPHAVRPRASTWARYGLDFALLAGGIAMTVRLYHLFGDDLQQTLRDLLRDPAVLAQRGAAMTGSGAVKLDDPATLLGPLMTVVGAALIGVRLFPLLMRIPARLIARQRSLVAPLTVWRVARDPGRYGVLVVTLFVTSLLVVSGLVLNATRQSAAWRFAHHEVGADVRLAVDESLDSAAHQWTALPGVMSAAPVMALRAGAQNTSLYGVLPDAMHALLPDFPVSLAALVVPPESLPGVPLPEGTTALQVEIYSGDQPDNPGELALDAMVLDARGAIHYPPLTAQPQNVGPFVTHRASLDALVDESYWRLLGIRLSSTHLQTYTFFMDDIAAVDDQGVVTVLEDFEAPQNGRWTGSLDPSVNVLAVEQSTEVAARGQASQKIDLFVKYTRVSDLRPILLAVDNLTVQLPVIVSETFAAREQVRLRAEDRLIVGDSALTRLDLPLGTLSLSYRVVGIVDDFPSASDESFIIAPLDALRMLANMSRARTGVYDTNQVWIDLDGRAPDAALRTAVQGIPGVADALYAHDRYDDLRSQSDSLAIVGALRIGGAVAVLLGAMAWIVFFVFGFSARSQVWHVWSVLGGSRRSARTIEAGELLVMSALAVALGMLSALLLIYLLLPFLATLGNETLQWLFG